MPLARFAQACLPLARSSQARYLFLCSIIAPLRRVRYDLGKEITVLLCAFVVAATFFYVFHDFLNHTVAAISATMRNSFAHTAALLCTIITAFKLGKFLRRATSDPYLQLQHQLGAEPHQRHLFIALRCSWALLLSSASLALLYLALLRPTSFVMPLLSFPLALLLGIAFAHHARPLPQRRVRHHTLFSWRWQQILHGERLLLGIAACIALTCYPLSCFNAPLPVFACVALLCGLITSFTLATQAARDAQFSWAEKNFGISHTQYMQVCEKIGASLALACMSFFVFCFISSQLLCAHPTLPLLTATLKVLLLAALAPLLMPSLLLQIDVRRPTVQFITATLCSLFIGTAILAHWFSILLYPLRWYALRYSQGRFYRA